MPDYKKLLSCTDPVFVLFLGASPAVALSGNIKSALAVGVAALIIVVLSALVMSLIGKGLSERARLISTVLVTAFFVSVVSQLMEAFLPGAYRMMGVYLAVLAVDLMIFGVAGNERSVSESVKHGLCTGLIFTVAICVLAALRMLLGGAIIESVSISMFNQPAGGLVLFAIELAVLNGILNKPAKEEQK